MLLLVVHLVLGYRRLQDMRYYADDLLVARTLGLAKLPDVATVSRQMATMDEECVTNLRRCNCDLVLDRLAKLNTARITLGFDGSGIGTTRFAEGTAVGFNRKKKGQRSYYPPQVVNRGKSRCRVLRCRDRFGHEGNAPHEAAGTRRPDPESSTDCSLQRLGDGTYVCFDCWRL